MRRLIFNKVKSIIPKISETEIIALKSGGTSIDKEIFTGKVTEKYISLPPVIQTNNDKKLFENIPKLLQKIGEEPIYPSPNIMKTMGYVGKYGFFGMIIGEKYGGIPATITSQARILTQITSYNPSLGVATMVPNSLGPGELLQHYGTQDQKNKYLPKLAKGELIPCFGLTGPNNGSDATGSIDKGVLSNGKIKVSLNKRYITLAPISNLIGVAFYLEDPNKELKKGTEGVTLALLERGHLGLEQKTYHNPNNAGFPNGTLKGDVEISLDMIIGGEEMAGNGWKMLMECLTVGRAISLPATANASNKTILYGIYHYKNHRKQFNIPIGKMEGVRNKFIDMFYQTWIVNAGIQMTNTLLDNKENSSVISAIMKQQTTERGRIVLNQGMDIYAGSGICLGDNNFINKFYQSAPVGITVEGSNTLTRSLMIFGQGLNKSHPNIFPIFQSIQDNNQKEFNKEFNSLMKHVIKTYIKSLRFSSVNEIKRLEVLVTKYASLTNFIAILGGKIKQNQTISGNMADILSNIYLAYSCIWYHKHINSNDLILRYCLFKLCQEAEYKLNEVIMNYPILSLKLFLLPIKIETKYDSYKFLNILDKELNTDIINELCNDVIKNEVLKELGFLDHLDNENYKKIYQKIIQVGEYEI